jgi:hypothetical protein
LKSWISDLKGVNLKMEMTPEKANEDDSTSPEHEASHDLDNKIRSTKRLYKEFKSFFSEFLLTTRNPVR